LFTEFAKGMILPKKEATAGKSDTVANLSAGFSKQVRIVKLQLKVEVLGYTVNK
jgi:hypothetical protein